MPVAYAEIMLDGKGRIENVGVEPYRDIFVGYGMKEPTEEGLLKIETKKSFERRQFVCSYVNSGKMKIFGNDDKIVPPMKIVDSTQPQIIDRIINEASKKPFSNVEITLNSYSGIQNFRLVPALLPLDDLSL